MLLTATAATVSAIWKSLRAASSEDPQRWADRARADVPAILKGAAATGSTGVLEAETVLIAAGIGVPTPSAHDALALFGAPPQTLYQRPGASVKRLTGAERVAATDLAYLMLQVERLGFEIDATPLCEALHPSLRAKAYLTFAEVAVYWHARERHRCEPLEVATRKGLSWGKPAETLRTVAGYRAELHRDPDGAAVAMTVTAPRWRPRRSDPFFAD